MAATADPRAKPPPAASHHLKPWAAPPPHRAHHVPSSLPGAAVASTGAARDRRRSSSSTSSHRRVGAGTVKEDLPCDGRVKDLRAKLMGHLREAADRLHLPAPPAPAPASPPKPPLPRPPEPKPTAPPLPQQQHQEEEATATRPWNLRDRKSRRPTARGAAAALDALSPASWRETEREFGAAAEKARWRSVVAPHHHQEQERAPFAVALTAEEVEEDVYALTGARPRRRPRKRPRVVQRQLDSLFPGLWLTEITADAYKVPDE